MEEHDLLTFYSAKAISEEKSKSVDDGKIELKDGICPTETKNNFIPIRFVDETKIEEPVINVETAQGEEDTGEVKKDSDLRYPEGNIMTKIEETKVVKTDKKEGVIENTETIDNLEFSDTQNREDKDIDAEEIQQFNSGIIPEVMTSDPIINSINSNNQSMHTAELSVSFERSGDEAVSIELSPTKKKEDNILQHNETKDIGRNSTHKLNVEKESFEKNDEIVEQKETSVLHVSFDKFEIENRSSDKELTDESLSTSGFDISSIINRLEDDTEDEISPKKRVSRTNTSISEEGKNIEIADNKVKMSSEGKECIAEEMKEKCTEKKIEDEVNKEKKMKKKSKGKDAKQKSENMISQESAEEKQSLDNLVNNDKNIEKAVEDLEINNAKDSKQKILDEKRTGKIENGFVYIDPKMPKDWYVMVKKRSDGKPDSYLFTPSNTKLRSKSEIVKFVEGSLPSKPVKKEPTIPVEEMPLRENLEKEDFGLTREIDPKVFSISKDGTAVNSHLNEKIEIKACIRQEEQEATKHVKDSGDTKPLKCSENKDKKAKKKIMKEEDLKPDDDKESSEKKEVILKGNKEKNAKQGKKVKNEDAKELNVGNITDKSSLVEPLKKNDKFKLNKKGDSKTKTEMLKVKTVKNEDGKEFNVRKVHKGKGPPCEQCEYVAETRQQL